jgi:hypothetical protein
MTDGQGHRAGTFAVADPVETGSIGSLCCRCLATWRCKSTRVQAPVCKLVRAASRPAHGARDLQLKCNDFLAPRVGESERVCVRMRVRMYEWTRRHACMHACVHACVCMHVFMHVFIGV